MIDVSLRLRRAIFSSDAGLVKRIVQHKPEALENPDFADKSNKSLHLAAKQGSVEVVRVLLDAGHDAGEVSRNTDWDTPLMLAVSNNQQEVAHLLIEICPQCIPLTNKLGLTALSFAAQYSQSANLIPFLLTDPFFPCSVRSKDVSGNTALHHASAAGSREAIRALLEAGADPNARNKSSWTPLAYSSTVAVEVYFKQLIAEIEHNTMNNNVNNLTAITTNSSTTSQNLDITPQTPLTAIHALPINPVVSPTKSLSGRTRRATTTEITSPGFQAKSFEISQASQDSPRSAYSSPTPTRNKIGTQAPPALPSYNSNPVLSWMDQAIVPPPLFSPASNSTYFQNHYSAGQSSVRGRGSSASAVPNTMASSSAAPIAPSSAVGGIRLVNADPSQAAATYSPSSKSNSSRYGTSGYSSSKEQARAGATTPSDVDSSRGLEDNSYSDTFTGGWTEDAISSIRRVGVASNTRNGHVRAGVPWNESGNDGPMRTRAGSGT